MKPPLFPWLLSLLSLLIPISSSTVDAQCIDGQKSILLQLNSTLKFNSSVSTKLVLWNQATDCCKWPGVGCDDQGRVIELDLDSEGISGGFDNTSALFNLGYLQILNLGNNSFNSSIPSGFEKLLSLVSLNLSRSHFSDQIPIGISRLNKLVTLDLSSIYFTGLPSLKLVNPNLSMFCQNFKNLTDLYLDGVNLSAEGSDWARALSANLSNLKRLSLSNCYLSGPIDDSLRILMNLSEIRLDQNNLSSPVPDFFANFTNLISLRLASCELNGTFPVKIFQIPSLQILDLTGNVLLQGNLPEFPKGSMRTMILSGTNFSGMLPDSIGNLSSLCKIDLMGCHFNGSLPSSIANLTHLVYVDFTSNSFTGSIPSFSSSKNLTQLILGYNGFSGSIQSTHWAGLLNLVNLDLRNNAFTGGIPLDLFGIPALEKMQLSQNQFSGKIGEFKPSVSKVLDTLDLSSNMLNGSIPGFFFDLTSLNIMTLASNSFTGEVQLNSFQHFKKLTKLELSYNRLVIRAEGSNSTSSSFPQFTTLKLASCNVTELPGFLKNQSKITNLDLSVNLIKGVIPDWIWRIGNGSLNYLNLSSNQFGNLEGPLHNLPSSLSIVDLHSNLIEDKLPTLPPLGFYLDYSDNKFTSVISPEIGNHLNFTIFFSLSRNKLGGDIPKSICNGGYLQVLDLSFNQLEGPLPPCLGMSATLGVLNLRGNNLNGTISDVFPENCGLKTLDINGNQIEGLVPRSLVNCTALEVLDFGNNNMADKFPCWLKTSSTLRVLILRSNMFHGSITCPRTNLSWAALQIIDLASNKFNGTLPGRCFSRWKAMMNEEDDAQSRSNHLRFEFLGLTHLYYQDAVTVTSKGLQMEFVKILTILTSIDFSCNQFVGNIPEELGQLKALYVLNFSRNYLTGHIPFSIGNLTQLESLDLSGNNLIGEIPTTLGDLNFLSFLNLSYNRLVGRIPAGSQLQTFTNASYLNNEGLCGLPLKVNCSNTSREPTAADQEVDFHWQFIWTGLGFGLGAGTMVGPLMFWNKWRKWYDGCVDRFLLMFLPLMGFPYTRCGKERVDEVEDADDDITEDDYDDDYEDDEVEGQSSSRRFCVFCTKLDASWKQAVHNPKCTCRNSTPVFSFYTSSSSGSS